MANANGEVKILAAVEQLDAKTVRERTEGLESLKKIFGQDRYRYRIDEISDDSFHKILESVFRIVRSEKQNYIRATSKTTQSTSSSRLANASFALRVIIEAVGGKLKQKTAGAVLDHVIDTVPNTNGGLSSPIGLDYLKSFSALLSHGPRGEYLRQKQWVTYVDFVLEHINYGLQSGLDDEDDAVSEDQNNTLKVGVSISLRLSQSSIGRNNRQKSVNRREELLLEEMLIALKHLTGITNAPITSRLGGILELVVRWLKFMSRSEDVAFEVLNHVLPVALSDNVVLAANIFQEVSQVIHRRNLWKTKSVVLRENMLASMILCQSLLSSTAWSSPLLPISCLEQILYDMRSDYEKLQDRDRLQIDDLRFTHGTSTSLISLRSIELVPDKPQPDHKWSTLSRWSTISTIACLLIGIARKRRFVEHNDGDEIAVPKRRKLQDPLDDLFQLATTLNAPGQVVALQLSLFVMNQDPSTCEMIAECLTKVHFADLEDDPLSTSWTCILIAEILATEPIQAPNVPLEFWGKVWHWACRISTTTSVTRPACFLLYTMVSSAIVKPLLSAQLVCEHIFPDGISGPSTLTDAALLLLDGVLMSGLLDTEKSYKHFATQTLRWLDYQWTISSVPDRLREAQMTSYARSDLLHSLFSTICGVSASPKPTLNLAPNSNICRATQIEAEDLPFTRYMLSDSPRSLNQASLPGRISNTFLPSPTSLVQLRQAAVELLTNKVRSFHGPIKERSSLIHLDLLEIAATTCTLCHIYTKAFGSASDPSVTEISMRQTWDFICTFLVAQSRAGFTEAFSRIAACVTNIDLLNPEDQARLSTYRQELCANLDKVVVENYESQSKLPVLDHEFSSSLDQRVSQSSQSRSSQVVEDIIRLDLAVSSDARISFTRQYLMIKIDLAHAHAESDPASLMSSMVVDAVISMDSEEILATRDIIVNFLDADPVVTSTDATRLLTRLAEVCLEDDELARCEAALCLCLRVTTRLVPLWATNEDDELANIGYDIYQWFVDIALGKGIASQRVLYAIAALLDNVLRSNPSYAADSLPSARTSLLQILRTGRSGLRFRLIQYLSNLFNGYVLSEHPAVFDDIIENLPTDPDRPEGIILRLYTIASLGAQWHTILRQSVYHIFETAANVPTTMSIATKCVSMVCKRLELESPRQLLKLFSPQVFYTWLEKEGMDTIPARIFGYDRLTALQVDVQEELVGQIAMRNSTEQIQNIVRSLDKSWDGLIERWFAKVIAYAILTDMAVHRSSREIGKVEMSLVQHLGEEVYAKFCRTHFAKAVSTLVLRLSDDRGFERVHSQEEDSQQYAATYQVICERSSSQIQLPPGQQPSFRAKHLMPILDRLCTRAQETLDSVWTPALLVHVYRTLLTDAKPAFGPLHTCAILRKIRVVLCLAGPVALSGYPLRMLLHALRPFLTQFHSAEDAFGVFWYLLEHGKPYLEHRIPFVTGLSVAVFASLSRFASSSQESTTQESHFTSTMSKAQQFRSWLGKYLEGFKDTNLHGVPTSTFLDIVTAAKQITKHGSSARTTAEGNLLFHLLSDQASDSPLLSKTFFHLTLRPLCENFIATEDFADDILYKDDDVLQIAPVLRAILDYRSAQEPFRIWVSQALGRAYAMEGPKIFESSACGYHPNSASSESDILVEDSYKSIVDILGNLLWSEDGMCASAAEGTLQSIFSALPTDSKTIVLGAAIDQSTFDDLCFTNIPCPPVKEEIDNKAMDLQHRDEDLDFTNWASEIVKKLCGQRKTDPVLSFLPAFMDLVPSMAPAMLSHVIHLALYFDTDRDSTTRTSLTTAFENTFDASKNFSKEHIQLALKSIVHLRRCVLPSESSMAKRNTWLAIDFGAAAAAALRCEMYRTALLMLEIHVSQYALTTSRSSRRSSHADLTMVPDLLNQIYQNIDDPDFFYGTHEESDVASIVEKLSHEGHGYKALSFQSALFDSNVKIGGMSFALSTSGRTTMATLNLANLNGLSSSIGSFVAIEHQGHDLEQSLQSRLNLHQWETARDKTTSDHGMAIMSALRALSTSSQRQHIVATIDQSTMQVVQLLLSNVHQQAYQLTHWTSLAILAELKENMSVEKAEDLETWLQGRSLRRAWTEQQGFECVEPILLGREALFNTIKCNSQLRNMMGVTTSQAILLEIKALRASLSLGHVHEMGQFCLNRAAYLSELLPSATELGVKVEAAIQYDLANTFWAQQETAASIRILQNLHERELSDQMIEVHKAEILTDLGSKITEARLDRPDEVTAKYLVPAIKALGSETMGSKVGRVFHNFAAFCDSQLRDADNVDEYKRVEKIRDRKLQEVLELESMYKKGDAKTRDTVKSHFSKAKIWFKLDDEEMRRLKAHRDQLVRNCLENYLLSLRACEDFPNDVLRFLALWMEQSSNSLANTSVGKYLSSIPTYKFAPLMNQLCSRILNEEKNSFQILLSDLMYHICEDHPFHGLYQVFATSKSRGAQKDEVANSRHKAATKLSEKVMKKSAASNLWISIHNSNIQFVRVAQEKIPDKELKTGAKLLLRKLPQGQKLEQTIQDMHHKIPPPTMQIEIRPGKDYSTVPTIAKFDPQISIAGGVSAPKIVTVVATDGSRHKMLLKGGNDDLRQDSIMEQVFEQVSNLLKDHRATRQRKLGIRTYKVIPLTTNAGIIEFVKDTMPLHDYILPAHTRYYPKDYKPNKCRKEIADAQSKSLNQRLQAYRNVVANFHPVMRFFFMEHFLDPDDWFQKRLNYSRSTAAISMLGHVLGLGDRHGHNILLDTKTGEVVHIDLGVAFEAGRVLPIPEVVPFRLTRDLVDGMGLSGVEGVFRRCCNFTLEALRRNQEAIMTILDVLRWDPLYSWSVSPLRLARMQENQEQAAADASNTASSANLDANAATAGASTTAASAAAGFEGVSKRNANEPSEADRALAVVSKKLGKSLSVEATVNELIRQATDEQNLAVLYCGWAAYA